MRPPRTFPYIPVYEILNGEIKPQIFQDKIVLIGAASAILERGMVTPTTDVLWMPEVEVHANVIHTILNNRFIKPIPTTFIFLLIIFFSITLLSIYRHLRTNQGLFILIILVPLIIFLGYGLFLWQGIWLHILPFLFIQLFAYIYILGVKLIEVNAATEQYVLNLSSQSQILYQRQRNVAGSQIDFWADIAESVSTFFNVDSMFFFEREGKSQALNMVHYQPDTAQQSVKQSEHFLNAPPYNHVIASVAKQSVLTDNNPMIVQDFMQDSTMDTLLIPLISNVIASEAKQSAEIIGFWVLNKTDGRDYFEQRRESIINFAHQISLELVKRQVTEELEGKARSVIKRLSSLFWKQVGTEKLQSLTQSTLEERTRVAAALNGIADGVILYD